MVPYVPAEAYDPQKKREKKIMDNKRVMRPENPIQGPGKGGRVPESGTLAQYVMQGLIKNEQRDMDPREALLKIAKEAESDPVWVLPAYKKTQPTNIFNQEALKQEKEKFLDQSRPQACKHCGLKLCTCLNKNN